MAGAGDNALFRALPALAARVPWAPLGEWPTPVTSLGLPLCGGAATVWIKREDLSHPAYGGNKLRTLEVALGRVLADGKSRVWASGAYGSNHVLATAIHAPRLGLSAGALLFPQPVSAAADENYRKLSSMGVPIVRLSSIAFLPFKALGLRGSRDAVMQPGSASIEGSLGATAAAIELAEQISRGECPNPERIIVPVGSTCTVSGILAGIHLARALGLAFQSPSPLPQIIGVRVTPWPVSSHLRIALRSRAILRLIEARSGRAFGIRLRALQRGLTVDGSALGRGYGHPTAAAHEAKEIFAAHGGPPLDLVYSAKAAAVLLAKASPTPTVFWATKSSTWCPPGGGAAAAAPG